MKITLFWRDKNWEARGYANNVWLNIYPDSKTYNTYKSPYSDISADNIVEVKRSSDISDIIGYLKRQGYQEETK